MRDFAELAQWPHRRLNPLTGDWVQVSPNRNARPWLGQVEKPAPSAQPRYDAACYLCPGNERAGGARNPYYKETFVFTNDYAALRPETPPLSLEASPLFVAASERGTCRVMCFSPRHDLTLPTMAQAEVRRVIDVWAEQQDELGALEWVNHVQIFENRGALMGASNPHPHCQIWANATLPNEPRKELESQRAYANAQGSCLLCDYSNEESRLRERVIFETEHTLVAVPFWAVWPFETIVIQKAHVHSLPQLSDLQREDLAASLRKLTAGYDRVFDAPFPYSMGFHQAPTDGEAHDEWHLHAHFYPPLLRSATVRKFMVGYEMLCAPQRDFTQEEAAQKLREVCG
jgi:UDPglucose--hexose-1-phosphate uridylyltransferase